MRYVIATLAMLLCSTAGADEAKWIFQRLAMSSVRIITSGGTGSGSIIAVHGDTADVLTCDHVTHGAKAIYVEYSQDGDLVATPATVIESDKGHDLSLLRATNPKHRPLLPIAVDESELFDLLYVVGAPHGWQRQSAVERINTKDHYGKWSLTGLVIPGMSGSGAVNDRDELECVISDVAVFGDDEVTSIGYCIPLPTIRAFLKGPTK